MFNKYDRVRSTSPLPGGKYQTLPDSGRSTPSPPSSHGHAYLQPGANPFGSPAPSIMSRVSSADSYSHNIPSQGQNAEQTLYGKKRMVSEHEGYGFAPEDDDDLHNPDKDTRGTICTCRGVMNLGCLLFLLIVLVVLFAGYPIMDHFLSSSLPTNGAFNIGAVNSSGQIPTLNQFALIDPDTPEDAYTWTSMETGEKWDLVFSDEFNRDGRSFYPGDDPFWEAVDLHYWSTGNKEWYDPRNVYTRDGHLVIELNDHKTHNMDYTGAMVQSWNRFCFTGGYLEAEVSLPGNDQVSGLWPAIWTMGNLGRAGFGGSLDGVWPYTYDSCDYGTFPNQTKDDEPAAALDGGIEPDKNYTLSYLPGQRLSRCTCENDKHHPGPKHKDGSFVGRGAPEIDVFEALVEIIDGEGRGQVSQSVQWAPFDAKYEPPNNTSKTIQVFDDNAWLNPYKGAVYQQTTSGLAWTNSKCYTNSTGCYEKYGFEYATGDDGYITWVSSGKKAWQVYQAAMGPNTEMKTGQRIVPVEPMYIIMNLGASDGFKKIDAAGLKKLMPLEMRVNYVRVYQDPAKKNIGCNPKDYPTADYIEKIKPAYYNPNITTWDQLVKEMPELEHPKNKELDTC